MLLVSTAGDPGWRRLSRVIARLPRLMRDIRSHRGGFLCQSALKSDPLSASKIDPLWQPLGGLCR